jgi:hypothetical protein
MGKTTALKKDGGMTTSTSALYSKRVLLMAVQKTNRHVGPGAASETEVCH